MAGVTREVKAALERLPDRISIGVLAKTFTNDLLDEVIDEADVREVRVRLLPARLVMIFTLACWLFMRSGYGLVMSKLADAHAARGPGWGDWEAPTTGPISRAKARLGADPLKLLFRRVSGPTGTPGTPGVFHRELRVLSVDGFTLDVPDTKENEEFFGRGTNGSDTPNPYPQLRALALAESGTRSLLGAAYGPYRTGEQTLMDDLLPVLGPGMLLLADRNFASYALWRKVAATGVALCWRMSASFALPVRTVLDDGTYLSELRPPRKKDGPPIVVRVVEYSVITENDKGEQVSELFCLATTLLDPDHAPAGDLAGLYHDRWQAETGIGDLKTTQRGGPEVVLRSKTPAMIAQEFWAMVCVYQAIRDLIDHAATSGLDPSRISFKRTLEAARDSATRAVLSPRDTSSAR
ncbi:IS4 family transposase [Actinokineospora sp.]|uniref:IS4 family transposase n=1 Tax=Actinokineospora sp. TaxID=1872133 RepID=UPI004037B1B5